MESPQHTAVQRKIIISKKKKTMKKKNPDFKFLKYLKDHKNNLQSLLKKL